jgi:hypothetical protein
VKVQNNSCCGIRRLLRVAASSNNAINADNEMRRVFVTLHFTAGYGER